MQPTTVREARSSRYFQQLKATSDTPSTPKATARSSSSTKKDWFVTCIEHRQLRMAARAGSADQLVGSSNYLGIKLFAAASAPHSSVSRAIFWASMTSPATRRSLGTKHQPVLGRAA